MFMGFFSYQLVFSLTIFMASNATAADAPKTDDKKKLQSWPPERVTRPKPTLPQPTLRSENLLKKAVIRKAQFHVRDDQVMKHSYLQWVMLHLMTHFQIRLGKVALKNF